MGDFKTYYRKGNKEERTYSTFIPDNRGFWILGNDIETNINFSKIGVVEAVRNYTLKEDFSLENMREIMTKAYKEVNYEKVKINKDFENKFSLSGITIKNNQLICGNIGSTSFRIYRDGKCVENIKGEKIKEVNIEKRDFLVLGNDEFWDIIDKNNYNFINEISYNSYFMKNLRKIIEYEEEKNNKEIVFLIVYVENLEEKFVKEKKRKENKFLYLLIYLMLFLVGVSFGKLTTIDNNFRKMELKGIEINDSNLKKRDIGDINLEFKSKISNYDYTKVNRKELKVNQIELNKKNNLIKNKYIKKENKFLTLDEEIKRNWKLLGRDENGDILTE